MGIKKMENSTSQNYLDSAVKQFRYYQSIANKTLEQVPQEMLFWQYNSESNSIAMVMQHIAGNMISRFTDMLTTDGEKSWRNRDIEFENPTSKLELFELWEKAWNILFETINNLYSVDLLQIVYIRNEGHTILEAINRQLAHYPYHIGQIVFIGKMIQNEEWKSLSIPKNQSKTYNEAKFSNEKVHKHFTDGL